MQLRGSCVPIPVEQTTAWGWQLSILTTTVPAPRFHCGYIDK